MRSSAAAYEPSARERATLRAHLDEVTSLDVRRLRDADEIARRAAHAVSTFAQVPCIVHRPERRERGWSLAFLGDQGAPDGMTRAFRDVLTTEDDVLPYDPLHPDPSERNRVISRVPDEASIAPTYWKFFARFGLHRLVHTRTLLCDGPRLLGWFGLFHAPAAHDTARAEWVLQTSMKRLRTTLRWVVGISPADARALSATLFDAIPGEAYLLDPDGRVDAVNTLGGVRLRRAYAAITTELRELARHRSSAEFDLYALEGASRSGAFVAVRRRHPLAELDARAAAAGTRWSLSATELRVLRLLGRGAANKEMAESLGISVRTTEAHVNSILRKSHADSRLQVVAEIWLGRWLG